jgi:hypothetical protein
MLLKDDDVVGNKKIRKDERAMSSARMQNASRAAMLGKP